MVNLILRVGCCIDLLSTVCSRSSGKLEKFHNLIRRVRLPRSWAAVQQNIEVITRASLLDYILERSFLGFVFVALAEFLGYQIFPLGHCQNLSRRCLVSFLLFILNFFQCLGHPECIVFSVIVDMRGILQLTCLLVVVVVCIWICCLEGSFEGVHQSYHFLLTLR